MTRRSPRFEHIGPRINRYELVTDLERGLTTSGCPDRAGRVYDVLKQVSPMSRDITGERATGIEPAFSAWEAHRVGRCHLHNCGKVQVNAPRIPTLLFAIAPCLSLRVARNRSHAACCTLLHGDRRGPRGLFVDGVAHPLSMAVEKRRLRRVGFDGPAEGGHL